MKCVRATNGALVSAGSGAPSAGEGRSGARPRAGAVPARLGLLFAGALSAACGSAGSVAAEPQAGPPLAAAPRDAAAGARVAAVKALGWYFANADAMPLDFAIGNAEKLRRVTTDEDLRRRLDELARRRLGELPPEPPRIDPDDAARRRWQALGPAVQDLLYRRALGLPWRDGADALGRLWAAHGASLLPEEISLGSRLVAARQALRLGLPAGDAYAQALEAIRAQETPGLRPGRRTRLLPFYACTHVVFTASDYYARYLDAAAFAPEVKCLDRALDEAAGGAEIDEDTADLLSEVLVSRKLLRIPPDGRTEAFLRRLVAQQNADGSWGVRETMTSRAHHTTVAILALVDFAPELRVGLDVL